MKVYRRKVKAPKFMSMHGRYPLWDQAWVDPGGTYLFGPGPYLKLPMTGDDGDLDDWTEHRIRPPGGYENRKVELFKEDGVWWWKITVMEAETMLNLTPEKVADLLDSFRHIWNIRGLAEDWQKLHAALEAKDALIQELRAFIEKPIPPYSPLAKSFVDWNTERAALLEKTNEPS